MRKVIWTYVVLSLAVHLVRSYWDDDSKIVGGYFVDDIKKMPWIVDIINESDSFFHLCGGSILTPVFVLTACHCLSEVSQIKDEPSLPENKEHFIFVAGSVLSGNMTDKHGQTRRPDEFFIHPKCREIDEVIVFDYALALMKRAFKENGYVSRINVLSMNGKDFAKKMYPMLHNKRTQCFVSGWGEVRRGNLQDDDDGLMSKKLKTVKMNIVEERKCRNLLAREEEFFRRWNFRKHQQICGVGVRGWGSDCQGDSGGPFVCDGFQVALVSFGMDCGISSPAIYAGLGLFFDWFNSEILPKYYSRKSAQRKSFSTRHRPHFITFVVLWILLRLIYSYDSVIAP